VRRCIRPIQPRPSPIGLTLVASTRPLILLVARYESRTTKLPEVYFSALLDNDGARDVRFGRALCT
jgi:hypothetical protein